MVTKLYLFLLLSWLLYMSILAKPMIDIYFIIHVQFMINVPLLIVNVPLGIF